MVTGCGQSKTRTYVLVETFERIAFDVLTPLQHCTRGGYVVSSGLMRKAEVAFLPSQKTRPVE